MSEETSSSSSSASSKRGTKMKRQSSDDGLVADNAALVSEEAESAKNLENENKRQRRSGQQNSDKEISSNLSCAMDEACHDSPSSTTGSPSTSTVITETISPSNETQVVNIASSSGAVMENLSEMPSTSIQETAASEGAAAAAAANDPAAGSGADDNAVADISVSNVAQSVDNNTAHSQRTRRIRRRSYRRPHLVTSSRSTSPIQVEENVNRNNEENGIQRNSDDSDAISDIPLLFRYALESPNVESDLDLGSSLSDDSFDLSGFESSNREDDFGAFYGIGENNADDDEVAGNSSGSRVVRSIVGEVMEKKLSTCTWNTAFEVIRREHGFSNRNVCRSMGNGFFNPRFYASQFVVERMKLSHHLRRHAGCVNSLNFNRSGNLLCSGSDDMRIVVWDWPHKKAKHIFQSGHRENIFQTKFINSEGSSLDIVSASRDGQVRRAITSSAGKTQTSCLYKHRSAVHKLVTCPNSSYEIMSVGEDGFIRHSDLRLGPNSKSLFKVVEKKIPQRRVRLFSIAHNPYAPEVCVCGSDEYVRVYDKRKFEEVVHEMCPTQLADASSSQVTCCTYNSTGTEVLATYSDEQIYLFDNKTYAKGEFLHRYYGHYNHRTIKGVNFFGPNSEYVISGSDCGHIFFWDKNTEAILNFMPGDTLGVVNCLEPHPHMPVLATSGLDCSVKIWSPGSGPTCLDKDRLKTIVTRNVQMTLNGDCGDFVDDSLAEFILSGFRPGASLNNSSSDENEIPDVDASSSDSSDSSDDNIIDIENHDAMESNESSDSDGIQLDRFRCHTQ